MAGGKMSGVSSKTVSGGKAASTGPKASVVHGQDTDGDTSPPSAKGKGNPKVTDMKTVSPSKKSGGGTSKANGLMAGPMQGKGRNSAFKKK